MNLADTPTDDLFAEINTRPPGDDHPLGRLAYETYTETMREQSQAIMYPAWEDLHPDLRISYQRAAEAVWTAAFQAGADSVQIGGSIE